MKKQATPSTNKQTGKQLGLWDFFALYKMSLRNFFWQVDNRQAMNGMRQGGIGSLCIWFLSLAMGYGLPLFFLFGLISFVQSLLMLPLTWLMPQLAMNPATHPGTSFSIMAMSAFLFLICSPIVFNRPRLKYNRRFRSSAWWQNTGISPREIIKDKGLFGEYCATMAAETNLKNYHLYGQVFNNVIIQKPDGDFTEIDVIYVNETGIHVIEAKARGGRLSGRLSDPTWIQKMGSKEETMDNPLFQNIGHINALTEYLFSVLPTGNTKTKAALPYTYVNVGLLCLAECDTSGLHDVPAPAQFFLGPAEGNKGYLQLDLRSQYKIRLSREEIDLICAAIQPLCRYSKEEIHQFVQQRQLAYDRGDYKYPTVYYMVRLEGIDADGRTYIDDYICRERGPFKTYLDMADNAFKAMPNVRILGVSEKTNDLPRLLAYYNQKIQR
ncbi:MAG: NERD domain-containing protein [Ruminiclostridium sp.]|nr:NERD domain-containing protein [Ruminiclostridium sp.]